jgi:CHAT domain-containing protein
MAASPLDQDRLRLAAEVKQIRNALQRSRNRENWSIESNEAATVDDLRRALLDIRPSVVHFAGHGEGVGGLCFEDQDGYTHTAEAEPLVKLFHHFKKDLKCIVLNACYSDVQADVLRQEIDYVVGMRSAIEDETATKFAVAFYDAVFAGTDFRTALDLGCTALDLNKLPDSDVPVFLTSPHLGRTTLDYNARIPEIERFIHAYINTPYSERAPFTTTGETLIPLLERHYGEQMHRTVDKVQVVSMQHMDGDRWRVAAQLSAGQDQWQHVYYFHVCDRRVILEWEATVGLWSIPVKTYLALGSSEDIVARVTAELDTYYFSDFYDKEDLFQCVKLRTADRELLHGYVRTNTRVYKELMTILSDGREHSLTLAIANITDNTSQPVINRVLSKSWIYHPDDEAAQESRPTGTT